MSQEDVYVIDDVVFDHKSCCLFSSTGEKIKLGFKESEVLHALCERPFTIISRDELQSNLWGNNIGSDINLNRAVYVLRRKLLTAGLDSANVIETVPRIGYMLSASIKRNLSRDNSYHTSGTSININQETDTNKNDKSFNHKSILYISLTIFVLIFSWFGWNMLSKLKGNNFHQINTHSNVKLYIDDRITFNLNENKLQELMRIANDIHIKHILIGVKAISLHRSLSVNDQVLVFFYKKNTPEFRLEYILKNINLIPILIGCDSKLDPKRCNKYIFPYGKINVESALKVTCHSDLLQVDNQNAAVTNTTSFLNINGKRVLSSHWAGMLERNIKKIILKTTASEFEIKPSFKELPKPSSDAIVNFVACDNKNHTRLYYKIDDGTYITSAYGGMIVMLP
ncbi:winged helix-turn-helix domain-containing protein [Aeromonas veronii]|uniref:winged helix-turn-helix domain-containing protein n=1 Tax=Aeromonas veronii TaxID=654 RepID=UPI0035BB66A7